MSRSEDPSFRHRDVPVGQASEWLGPKVGMDGAAQGSAQSTGTAERAPTPTVPNTGSSSCSWVREWSCCLRGGGRGWDDSAGAPGLPAHALRGLQSPVPAARGPGLSELPSFSLQSQHLEAEGRDIRATLGTGRWAWLPRPQGTEEGPPRSAGQQDSCRDN